MPPLKDGVLRTIANHKANMTDEEVAEAQRGNVIDIAVATGGIAYVRINSEGKEKHVSMVRNGLKDWEAHSGVSENMVTLLAPAHARFKSLLSLTNFSALLRSPHSPCTNYAVPHEHPVRQGQAQ